MLLAMSWAILKIAVKAKRVPEVAIVGRILLGAAGGFVLLPVISSLLDPTDLAGADYLGLVVFTAVGLWLLRTAVGRAAPKS